MASSTQTTDALRDGKRARIGTILVPTDFSRESFAAVHYAASLLRQFDGALHLVHVHDVDYSYAMPMLVAVAPMVTAGEVEAYCRGELQKVGAQQVGPHLAPTLHCETGRAFDEICRLATEIKADLLVISTHGHTGFKHLMLGSTTERVVRHAPCPVLVVRAVEGDLGASQSAAGATASQLKLRKILLPVDFSACSAAGVRYGVALAKTSGASLKIVHAIQVQPFIPADRFAAYSREPSPGIIERAAKMQMRKFIKTIDFKGVPYESSIEIGRPAYSICDTADRSGADLIITSTHGVTGFTHVLVGSVAEHIVRYARCPVLVVPTREGCDAKLPG